MAKRLDVFTKAKRSEVMSKIRGKGNRDTKIALAKLFRANGITGWRRHYPITGRPDFAFPKHKLAVFVYGCFWHNCPKHGTQPKGNKAFWQAKLKANKARDQKVNRLLRSLGWKVIRIWEHELRHADPICIPKRLQTTLAQGLQQAFPVE